jgi:phytoene/squalene synthetase
VRYADEIVDTFHGFDKKKLLDRYKAETYLAIEEGISLNPVLHSFQKIVRKYNIEHELIEAFLHSMEMDLYNISYDADGYNEYIYGSAEVVGLMCLKVFCLGDESKFQSLVEPARKLGSAFQKVNFLRDIKSDFEDRKRIYFPGLDISRFSKEDKQEIEKEIAEEFRLAQIGIKNLPENSKKGVQLALNYYSDLLKKIASSSTKEILENRIRITNAHKIRLFMANFNPF